MKYNSFLENQMHPEKDETACIRPGDSGRCLSAALDVKVVSCGGAFTAGNFLLFTVEEAVPQAVFRYLGSSPESLADRREIARFDVPVTAVSCWEDDKGGGFCVSAGEVSLFDLGGKKIAVLPVIARHAALCAE